MPPAPTERPNVVVVTTHDSGRHFGPYGVDTVRTPAIDDLAADGYRFANYFTASPQCSPSRAAMLTGLYPQRNGVMGLAADPWGWDLRDGVRHLSEHLAAGGYHTALFGYQHETPDTDRLAFETLDEGTRPGPELAESVAAFFGDAADEDRPFYAQVGVFETHEPLDYGDAPPDDELGVTIPPYVEDTPDAREYFAQLQGSVRRVDETVAALRDGLADAGVEEETLFVFTSDHGITFSRAKGYLYDPGIEVPLLMHWPDGGVAGGETCDWLLSNVDFLPTVLECCDLPVPGDLDGASFARAFDDGGDPDPPREAVYASYTDHHAWNFGPEARCVRTAEHKLIRNFTPDRRFEPPVELSRGDGRGPRSGDKTGGGRPPVELYDLEADPNEFENIADDPAYESVREELDELLWSWLDGVDDPLLSGPMGSPYYERAVADAPVATAPDRTDGA
ncbi:MAG: sulfatase [Halobacteriaceae archaeon]